MSTDAELAGEISIDPTEFINALKRASTAFDDFSSKLTGFGGFKSVESGSMAASVAIGNMVAQAATKLGELATSVISAGFAFNGLKEQANIAFTNLLGSGQAAKKFLDELAAFAAKTPFEFPELVKSAQRLTAMGFASREVIPMLTAVGNAVSAMGGSAAQIDRVTTALTQMKAKGKVSAEEMMQLAEAGIPAWGILAEKIGKSIPDAMKLAEKGAISADVAIEGLIEGMQSKFGGMMEAQATTWQGMLSTLNDTTAQMAGQIMEPLFNASKDTLTKILAGLPEFQKQFNDAWKSIVTEVGNSLSELKPIVSAALNDVKSLWEGQHNEIINITKFAWNAVYAGFIKPAVDGISRLISTASRAFAGDWEGAMNRLVASTDLAGSKILGTVGRWVQALARVSGLITGISGIANAASQGGGAAGAVDGFWKDAAKSMQDKSKAAEDAAYAAGQRVSKAVASGIKGGGGGKSKGSNEAEKAMRELLSSINEYVAATGNGVRITEQAWVNSAESVRQSMIRQRDEFVANKEATSRLYLELKGGLLTVYPQLGAEIVAYIKKLNEAATITAQVAPKMLEFIQPSKAIAAEVKKAEKDLEDSNKKIQKMNDDAAKEAEKAAKKIHDAMLDQFEDLSRKLPDSWNTIIEGIVNGSGKVGDAVYESAIHIKGWANDILGAIEKMPGKFGDVARGVLKTVDQWVQFADKVLGIIGRLTDNADLGIASIFTSIAGIFKKESSTQQVSGAIKNLVTSATQSATSAATAAGQAAGGAVTGGVASGIQSTTGTAISAVGGLFSALTGAVSTFAQTFQSDSKSVRFAGGFLLGGPVGGILSAIFGGPSEFEKQKRALQLDTMKANIASVYEDIKSKMVDVMAKGQALLEEISVRTDTPRKAIKRFVNQLGLLLELFIDESKRLAPMGMDAAKAVTENLGGAFELMLGAVDLNKAIQGMKEATVNDVAAFKNSSLKLFDALFGVFDAIEMDVAKQAGKKSDRLKSVIDFATAIPNAIKAAVESPALKEGQLSILFNSARSVMNEFFKFSDELESIALKKTSKDAGLLQGTFESGKSMFEFLGLFSTYKPFDASVLGVITADLQKLFDWSRSTLGMVTAGISDVDRLAEALRSLTASFGGVTSGIAGLTGGGRSGITSSIVRQDGALYARGSASSSSTSSTRNETININLNFSGTVITEGELLRKTREEVTKLLKERDDRLRLASVS